MNYLAHGFRCLHDPYLLAGSAVPDWLGASDRDVHLRQEMTSAWIAEEGVTGRIARGVKQHLDEDRWFHSAPQFLDLCDRFTAEMRPLLGTGGNVRASFVAHVIIELLMDGELDRRDPRLVARYYEALDAIDRAVVQDTVGRITGQRVDGLGDFIARFAGWRFLADYQDDARLCFRMNQVLGRVKLEPLPAGFADHLPRFRAATLPLVDELLSL